MRCSSPAPDLSQDAEGSAPVTALDKSEHHTDKAGVAPAFPGEEQGIEHALPGEQPAMAAPPAQQIM